MSSIKLTSLLVIYLLIIIPVSFSLSISDVKSEPGSMHAVITWQTDEPATSKVNYGSAPGQITESESNLKETKEHLITIGNLEKNTQYFFEIQSGTASDNKYGEYYTFTTASSAAPPKLEVSIPGYTNRNEIDISGTTDPYVKLEIYINGVKTKKQDPKAETEFNFANVQLPLQINTIQIDAIDADNNKNTKTFSVAIDKKQPVINLQDIPSATTNNQVNLKGAVDENATLTILVNGEKIYEQVTQKFEQSVSLKDGNNLITIGALDRAGNTAVITKTILSDDEPPKLEAINPETGSFFYEGHAVTTIRGYTEPYAKVELYYNTEPDNKPDKTVAADENGRFEFKDFNIEYGFRFLTKTGRGDLDLDEEPYTSEPGTLEEYAEIQQRDYGKQEELGVQINLVAIDAVGLKTQQKLQYRIGTCFSGNMDFNVINMIEYQSPTILSPERLEQGTEIITFVLNLTYTGRNKNPEIKNVRIERACEATAMQKDDEYKYSCGIMSSSPNVKKSNDEKTLWYIRYDLQALKNIESFSTDLWEDLTNQMTFPLKIRIEYTDVPTYEYENTTSRKFMTKCLPVAYTLDTSKIDPRDLPDGLLIGLQSTFNGTITLLNQIIPWVDQVNRIAGLSCFATFLGKMVVVIMKRFSSYSEHFTDKPLDDTDVTKCPPPGRTIREKNTPVEKVFQDDFDNEELEARCPQTAAYWKTEADFDSAMKWACDRFLCRAVPAGWTEDADIETIRINLEKSSLCGEKVGTQNTILRKLSSNECNIAGISECYEYEGSIYVYDKRNEKGEAVLKRASTGGIPKIGAKESITVMQAGPNSQLKIEISQSQDCKASCTAGTRKHESGKTVETYKWNNGACMTAEQFSKFVTENNYPAAPNADRFVLCPKIGNVQSNCYCYDEKPKAAKDAEKENKEFDYRLNKVRLYDYSNYRYYEERDQSACLLGSDSWLNKYDPVVDPRSDIFTALQCGCVTQVRARLILLRNMMQGFNNCIEQVKKTGKYNTGICKEIFTQYICRWTARVIAYMIEGCTPFQGKPDEISLGDNLQAFAGSIFGGAEEAAMDLVDDYDSPALRDYFGVGEGAIAEKMCLGALTGDWGMDFEGFMDAAYQTPFHTAVQVFPAEREYLTWDPSNEQSTFEYRLGWMISAGCPINSYDVRLGCISNYEYNSRDDIFCERARNPKTSELYNSLTGCDCMAANEIGQSVLGPSSGIIYQGRNVPQGAFEDKSIHVTQDSLYRYDHVVVRLNIADPELRDKCLPEGHKDGLFYFPISDLTPRDAIACRFDKTSGQFICDGGKFFFDQKGSSYFGKVECDEDIDCEDKIYYLKDPIDLSLLQVYNLGPEKCLFWNVQNRKKEIIVQGVENIPPSPDDKNHELVLDKKNLRLVDSINVETFSKVPATVYASPSSPSAGVIHEYKKDKDVAAGTEELWFIDTDKDNYGDKMIIGNKEGKQGESFTQYDVKYINGAALRFVKPEVPKSQYSCNGYPCYKYILHFTIPTIDKREEAIEDQVWTIHLDIRAMPETGRCEDATEKNVITSRGAKQTKDLKIKVTTKSKAEKYRCNYLSGEIGNENIDWCDCDGKTQQGDELAYKGIYDCNGVDKKYCYFHSDGMHKCESIPKCYTGPIINNRACDCDLDGVISDPEKNCKYCDADKKQCTETKPTEPKAPVIKQSESKIGAYPLNQLAHSTTTLTASAYKEISPTSQIKIMVTDEDTEQKDLQVIISTGVFAVILTSKDYKDGFFVKDNFFKDLRGALDVQIQAKDDKARESPLTTYYVKIPKD